MDWQYPLTVALIAVAGTTVLWQFSKVVYSVWTGKGCGSGCGKCHSTPPSTDKGRVGLPLIRND
ncbi:hypothetical protein [Zavarzinella formosa]|uniref:hypothetical protein n=1 Tax=Zavarzinella formosa TaxID=360055 RepID=UPI000305AD69|nr:hypothetical protein [Zavarzinella formosa]